MPQNQQWRIATRPTGRGLLKSDFSWHKVPLQKPKKSECLLKTLYLDFNPAQKGWMENVGGYLAPTEIGDVMPGSGIGQVIESSADGFKKGDIVMGSFGWQTHPVIKAAALTKIENDEMITAYLSVLGVTGVTAYFGLLDIGQPKAGDTVVVSGAAGATGSIVGQIAKLSGCRTIGIAGGPKKCKWLIDEVGYDAAIDYKNENVQERLETLCNQSVNVFFDNVGGDILNDVLAHIDMKARVVICGGISRYETGAYPKGPDNYFNLIFKRAKMEGFIVLDYMSEFPLARTRLKSWIKSGQLVYKEDIQTGFENAPTTLMRLFSGQNFGKQLLKVAERD